MYGQLGCLGDSLGYWLVMMLIIERKRASAGLSPPGKKGEEEGESARGKEGRGIKRKH